MPLLRPRPPRLATALLAAVLAVSAQAADKLPSFKVDRGGTTVSGLSAGAFMAVQLQVAYSARIQGAGVVAGGPYGCAQGSPLRVPLCMGQASFTRLDPAPLLAAARRLARRGDIDDLEQLKTRRLYLFAGTQDTVVKPAAVQAAAAFFRQAGVPEANLLLKDDVPAGHAFVTPAQGNACGSNEAPYISHCSVDGHELDLAGALLAHLLGPLKPRAAQPSGQLLAFDQRAFAGEQAGLAQEGFVYVPKACAAGETCRVHVALHGCLQGASVVGQDFMLKTGYREWADNNRLLVLYPQVERSRQPVNPGGCWDWFGYTGANYAVKSAPQMAAIMKMVQALGGGA